MLYESNPPISGYGTNVFLAPDNPVKFYRSQQLKYIRFSALLKGPAWFEIDIKSITNGDIYAECDSEYGLYKLGFENLSATSNNGQPSVRFAKYSLGIPLGSAEEGASFIMTGRIEEREADDTLIFAAIFAGSNVRYRVRALSKSNKFSRRIEPHYADVYYGPNYRQKMDIYSAATGDPAPVVVLIHGGGWGGLGKYIAKDYVITKLSNAGIHHVSIEYRWLFHAHDDDMGADSASYPLYDAARAIQYLRYKADEYNINPDSIGVYGGSAGGASALWLAYHDDLARTSAEDPILRQSSRVQAVASFNGQSTLVASQAISWIGEPVIEHGMMQSSFGVRGVEPLLELSREGLPQMYEYSSYWHVSSDDPPTFLQYLKFDNVRVPKGGSVNHAIHHPAFGHKLAEKLDYYGVENTMITNEEQAGYWSYQAMMEFFIEKLK